MCVVVPLAAEQATSMGGALLQDKVIVVSGVGPGLGLEVARLCLRDGASVPLAR